jgi:hypothetical protein
MATLAWRYLPMEVFWAWLAVSVISFVVAVVRSLDRPNWYPIHAERRPFFLLLRSVSKADKYRGKDEKVLPTTMVRQQTRTTVFEEAVALAMGSIGPLVSVQTEREYVSHRWIHIDGGALWTDVVEVLMEHARGILIIPGDSPGIESEAAILAERYLQKTIVLIPPSNETGMSAEIWGEIRERWATAGYRLPSFDEGGEVYLAGPRFAPKSTGYMRTPTDRVRIPKARRIIAARLRAALEGAITQLPPGGTPLAEVAETIERAAQGERCGILSEWQKPG